MFVMTRRGLNNSIARLFKTATGRKLVRNAVSRVPRSRTYDVQESSIEEVLKGYEEADSSPFEDLEDIFPLASGNNY